MFRLICAMSVLVLSASAAVKPLMIGDTIPETDLKTIDGNSFSLTDAVKEKPVVLIYYRGGWCPYCNVHLSQLQEIEPQIRDMGYRIIAVSADQPSKVQESLDKEKLSYTLLSDSAMKTADAFGIAFKVDQPMLKTLNSYNIDIEAASGQKHHMLPIPSVFIIGTDGIIDFVYANPDYTVRLEPDVLLAAAKAAAE